jgi:hypothetical protein
VGADDAVVAQTIDQARRGFRNCDGGERFNRDGDGMQTRKHDERDLVLLEIATIQYGCHGIILAD